MEIKKNKITVVLGIDTDLNISEEKQKKDFEKNIQLSSYIKSKFPNLTEEKLQEAFKICLLKEKDANKTLNTLSTSEVEKVELLQKILENKEMLILSDFENAFLNKELNYFKNLFKKMVTKYKKTIVFITNKLELVMDIADILLVVENKKVILELNAKDIYYDKIYEYVETPEIIQLVKLIRKKHVNMPDYIDIKELIKAIYRSVS